MWQWYSHVQTIAILDLLLAGGALCSSTIRENMKWKNNLVMILVIKVWNYMVLYSKLIHELGTDGSV